MKLNSLLAQGAIALGILTNGTIAAANEPVQMVVTAAFVSNAGLDVYDDLAAYLSEKTGREIEIISGLSYEEADAGLDSGEIAIGAICGLPYVQKAGEGNLDLLATPVMATGADVWSDVPGYSNVPGKYYSYTIVHKDSPIQSWEDLRGQTYVFNDMGSNSGYNMPRAKLVELGARSFEEYFSRVLVSGAHEESIRLVAEGLVTASSVDSLVLDYDRSINDPYANDVRIIEVLFDGGAGAPPMVINSTVDPAFKSALQNALVTMHEDEAGKAILKAALLERFDMPTDSNYDDIRAWQDLAREAGFADFGSVRSN